MTPKTTDTLVTANERWIQEQEHLLYPSRQREFFNHKNCRACGPGPLGRDEIPSAFTHVFYGDVHFADVYGQYLKQVKLAGPSDADVVSSEIEGEKGMHSIMLDIDVPARLIESSTPGHFHLYIDHKLSWWKYKTLLRALWKAGVIEKGFYKSSLVRKGTHLRPPWKEKGNQ